MSKDPFKLFSAWFKYAEAKSRQPNPNSVCVSNIDENGFPDARMVLLKDFDERGFVFYTNFNSPKGRALQKDPRAALTFHWDTLERQIRIQGNVEKVADPEADAYFRTRPRLSQLGAWASEQSAPLSTRLILLRRVAELALKFRGQDVPRPPLWSGFRVIPERIEFWRGRKNRLHDRFLYIRSGNHWKVTRLYP